MYSRHHRKARVVFGLFDVLLTALAFEAAYQSRQWLPFERIFYLTAPVAALLLGFAVVVWLLLGLWLKVYDRLDAGRPQVVIRDSFRQCFLGAVAVVIFQYLLRLDLSRPFLVLFAGYSWIFLSVFRLAASGITGVVRRELSAPHYVMVVGLGERARRLGETLERSRKYGVRLAGFVAEEPGAAPERIRLEGEHPVYPLSELRGLLRRQVIDEIIFAVDSRRLPEMEEMLVLCDEEGVRTRVAVDFFPHVNSEVYLDRLGATPLLTFAAAPHDEVRLLVKRSIDVMIAALGLLLLAPFLALIVVLIRLTSPGPAVFRQERCGLNGRRFTLYKFRSMVRNAEELKASLEALNLKNTAFKIRNDPRLTPLGRIMRKFSIDELPQLWNVLKGDMSLVGPRPAVPAEVERYSGWQRRRLRMRPGMTCLWALKGRDHMDFDTWMKMDMHYMDNWSLALDWKVLLLTVPKVLTGKGAY
ncbi:MAG: sugar transferase [Acidobacteria bacterium]|nr:sugar transferase [Acidobacteriota bacterium]